MSMVLALMALGSFLFSHAATQNAANTSIAGFSDLLLKDEIQQLETLLSKQPRTAQTVAFRGEIEFRKGHFEQAEALYREALKMDSKTARAHFGLARLALGKVNNKTALQELARAIELDPKEPLYHLYASEAWGI